MKAQKRETLAAKMMAQMMIQNMGHDIANFLVTAKEAGIPKKDRAAYVIDLMTSTVTKVAKNPDKYRFHGHGGH